MDMVIGKGLFIWDCTASVFDIFSWQAGTVWACWGNRYSLLHSTDSVVYGNTPVFKQLRETAVNDRCANLAFDIVAYYRDPCLGRISQPMPLLEAMKNRGRNLSDWRRLSDRLRHKTRSLFRAYRADSYEDLCARLPQDFYHIRRFPVSNHKPALLGEIIHMNRTRRVHIPIWTTVDTGWNLLKNLGTIRALLNIAWCKGFADLSLMDIKAATNTMSSGRLPAQAAMHKAGNVLWSLFFLVKLNTLNQWAWHSYLRPKRQHDLFHSQSVSPFVELLSIHGVYIKDCRQSQGYSCRLFVLPFSFW